MKSTKGAVVAALGLLFSSLASAGLAMDRLPQAQCEIAPSCNYTLLNFNLYSAEAIDVCSSDLSDGSMAAAGDISMKNYSMFKSRENQRKYAIINGGEVSLHNTTIEGWISTLQYHENNSTVMGTIKKNSLMNFSGITQEMNDLSQSLAADPDQESLSPEGNDKPETEILIEAKKQINTYKISAAELARTGNIIIKGEAEQTVVVNIYADGVQPVVLQDSSFDIEGAIERKNIYWNFVDAQKLLIQHDGDIPGIVLAPKAETEFYAGKIVGALYVKKLHREAACSAEPTTGAACGNQEHPGDINAPSGQINGVTLKLDCHIVSGLPQG